jgi:hypothetical protein
MNVWIVALMVFIINLPFGYWRANVKKFSLQWILSIHVPVPFVILLRIYGNIGFAFITYPILVGAFFGGQFAGKAIHSKIKTASSISPGSCLVMDVYRIFGEK